ncbi:MAG: hypothetical protein HYR88_05075 [Verrucomicrobia bacterium]|nr:hypothetical protein [Verrucomicrobiota bacterium]MBI3871293.1 hypothetical protein [Verrucomicrobiota bacterium]
MKQLLTLLLPLLSAGSLQAATTIDGAQPYAYGANIGWIDWRGDGAHGAVLASGVCSGFIYSANVGWISLGSGAPLNGTQYQNNSATDYGVNIDAAGNLSGSAYGANIGWIQFEPKGSPQVNLATGDLSGYAYSANCGWISLGSASGGHLHTGPGLLGGGGNALSAKFGGVSPQSNGSVLLYGSGVPNLVYTVLANTQLEPLHWAPIGTAQAGPLGTLQFFDINAPSFKQRFYRFNYP